MSKGRLIAEGEEDNPILFTSSRVTPSIGDWKAVLFEGGSYGSLKNVKLEYGGFGRSLNDCLNPSLGSPPDVILENVEKENCSPYK